MVYGSVPTAKKRVLLRSESRLQVLHLKREKIRIEQSQQSADSYGAGVARIRSPEKKFRSWLPLRESLRARRRVNPGVEKCCACCTFGQKIDQGRRASPISKRSRRQILKKIPCPVDVG